MATVKGKTSIKIDELIESSIVSGFVNSTGHLILQNRGGAEIDAGFIAKPFGETWSKVIDYKSGDVVGYAGVLWKATSDSNNKPPALFNSVWRRLAGESSTEWAEGDGYFTGDTPNESYNFFWQNGNPTVSLTSIAGEFETGTQALKISAAANAEQRFFIKEENIINDGETVVVSVRARLLSANPDSRIQGELIQSGPEGLPEPFGTGAVASASAEGPQAMTTSWATYTFTMTAAAGKPRSKVNLVVTAGASGAAIFLIDRIRTTRASNTALAAYPVGSVFINTSNTNPKDLLGGGTWVAWGSGRVPVGVDLAQTEFNAVEKTGGAKTHTLTPEEIPDHNHYSGTLATSSNGNHSHTLRYSDGTGTATANVPRGGSNISEASNAVNANGDHSHTVNGETGIVVGANGYAHNNLSPYITCYMWKRTA